MRKCGIDIIELERFERFYQQHEQRGLTAIFTQHELASCEQKPQPKQSLAARFAVKEACLKCFPKENHSQEIDFIDIEVDNDGYGAPFIKPSKSLQTVMAYYHIKKFHVSLSHTQQFACAIVLTASEE